MIASKEKRSPVTHEGKNVVAPVTKQSQRVYLQQVPHNTTTNKSKKILLFSKNRD